MAEGARRLELVRSDAAPRDETSSETSATVREEADLRLGTYMISSWGTQLQLPGFVTPIHYSFPPTLAPDFRARLEAILEAEPLEDGVTHTAEGYVAQGLRYNGPEASTAILSIFLDWSGHPILAAALLHCIGRLPRSLADDWGVSIVRTALRSEHVVLREAAVRVVENWEARDLAHLLREHTEPEGWLAEYLQQVLGDLVG